MVRLSIPVTFTLRQWTEDWVQDTNQTETEAEVTAKAGYIQPKISSTDSSNFDSFKRLP